MNQQIACFWILHHLNTNISVVKKKKRETKNGAVTKPSTEIHSVEYFHKFLCPMSIFGNVTRRKHYWHNRWNRCRRRVISHTNTQRAQNRAYRLIGADAIKVHMHVEYRIAFIKICHFRKTLPAKIELHTSKESCHLLRQNESCQEKAWCVENTECRRIAEVLITNATLFAELAMARLLRRTCSVDVVV